MRGATSCVQFLLLTSAQKKRRYDDREEREKTPEPQEDPLKDATTLYVGNLYVSFCLCCESKLSLY